MIKFINSFNNSLSKWSMVILDPKCLIYEGCFIYFPFRTLRPNVNAVVTVLAIEHWLLWCGGHLKFSYHF